jgi:hypothetical protein
MMPFPLDLAATFVYNEWPTLSLFTLWIQQHASDGVFLHPSLCFVQNSAYGFGVACHEFMALRKGTVIARIPKKFILSVRTVSNPELRNLLRQKDLVDVIGLSIAYLYECSLGPQSQFFEYLLSFAVCPSPQIWDENIQRLLSRCEYFRSPAWRTVLTPSTVSP